ncbi:lauroyl acyltransferase [Vulcaniibacterium tengchongense]|uniref:KDO2-lipid IV(A) lauroyltransferase n=1 Tax=Vulcaniibacterium tengchongense TaxID=1273429 RepID=A0A3N4W1B0_9GAMM|nr:lauroyl acyltransferase [Vulcaniibacterium tengchongense]RPE79820.1 KDO2-lipid IV(A) lauroyltransferase [Vulcaniibacterium tengchongense]
MTDFAARLLYASAWMLGRLPWPLLLRLGDALALWWRWREVREARVARVNLELAYPELAPAQRERLRRAILRTTARQALETARLWTRPHARNLDELLVERHGTELMDRAIAAGRGVIVAAPHHGNWELLNQWLAWRTPLAILYRPPESPVVEGFLTRVRAAAGDAERVTQVRAEGPAVRQLFKRLGDGGVIGILPDQQPKAGDGEFAPFFGVPALTMTLLGRLAARTGAAVLFAWCERLDESTRPRFALRIEQAPPGIADPDPKAAVAALNAEVERIARRDPAQYQWTYKRYTLRPPGSGEPNPYHNR